MKNTDSWAATKFVRKEGKDEYSVNRDTQYVARGSRFVAQIQLDVYRELIEKYAGGRLLDLGCGLVPLYEIYKGHVDDNICVDWADSYHRSKYLDVVADLNSPLPVKNASVDTVLSTDVVEHIYDLGNVFSEISRILKSGGTAIITTPFFYSLHEEPYDFYRLTRFALERLCENHNLKVQLIEEYGGTAEVIFDLLSKHTAMLPPVSWLVEKIGLVFCNSWINRKVRAVTRKKYPLGYSLVAKKI